MISSNVIVQRAQLEEDETPKKYSSVKDRFEKPDFGSNKMSESGSSENLEHPESNKIGTEVVATQKPNSGPSECKIFAFYIFKVVFKFFSEAFSGCVKHIIHQEIPNEKNVIFDLFSPKRESFYQKGSVVFKPPLPLFHPKLMSAVKFNQLKLLFFDFTLQRLQRLQRLQFPWKKFFKENGFTTTTDFSNDETGTCSS